MPKQFRHQGLAETHHLEVAFSLWIEIGSAFGSAHWQRRQRVFEYLFEGKKFENTKIDRGVKAHSALVRADGAVHLNSETAIHVKVAFIVAPRHPKHDHPLWLDNSLENLGRPIFGVPIKDKRERLHYFLDSLMKFRFSRVPRLSASDHF